MNNPLAFLLLGRNLNGRKLPYWPQCNKEEKYLQLDFTTSTSVKFKEEKDLLDEAAAALRT